MRTSSSDFGPPLRWLVEPPLRQRGTAEVHEEFRLAEAYLARA
ncbi:hypothetical protein [Nocardia goodfellowii]|uniref:Uncharacterized protein n=1 Tax=Nocardia goodfellowii TaxID=882446 RepID=A0ABS4QRA9_9NOCA|nr:hypothetical protein [Nocardia goodfellowii]MBP2194235.1 hypothetical protein [Nocardia goodfellowii]